MHIPMHDILIPLGAVVAALATWLAANFIGKPLLAVRDARLQAIRLAERYAYVSSSTSEEGAKAAIGALGDISTELRSLFRAQRWPVRLYCQIMRYDLESAVRAINGLQHMVGEYVPEQTRKNNLNLVYYSLHAYSHIPHEELTILEKALEEHDTAHKSYSEANHKKVGKLAEGKGSPHVWIGTGIAVLAFCVSAASAYFSWHFASQAAEAKKEALSMIVRPVNDCRTQYESAGYIGLCWLVRLSNTSENRISIVDHQVFNVQGAGLAWFGGFQNLEGANGVPLELPIMLEGGESKDIFVRGPIMLSPEAAQIIAKMPDFQNHALKSVPIGAIQRTLALSKTDFIGNKVEPMILDGKYSGFSISPPIKGIVDVLVLTTGRGATFVARMTYPPDWDRSTQ